MRDLDIEKGSQRAGETEMTLERNRCLRMKKKKKRKRGSGTETENKRGDGSRKSDLSPCHKLFAAF